MGIDYFYTRFFLNRKAFDSHTEWNYWMKNNVLLFIDAFILVLGGFTVFGLLGFHTYLMVKGTTTWECVSRERITYLKYLDDDYNPFSQGVFKNVYFFLCQMKPRNWELLYEKKTEMRNKNGIV